MKKESIKIVKGKNELIEYIDGSYVEFLVVDFLRNYYKFITTN